MRLLYALIVAGTALTNSTAETILSSYNLPANALQVGQTYRVRGTVIATATNSTDTLLVNVRIGPTTLTGTIVAAAAATDVANNDKVFYDLQITVRSGGILVVDGVMSVPGAEGTATTRVAYEVTGALDTTVLQRIEVTGTWSVANAGNSCRAESMTVAEVT